MLRPDREFDRQGRVQDDTGALGCVETTGPAKEFPNRGSGPRIAFRADAPYRLALGRWRQVVRAHVLCGLRSRLPVCRMVRNQSGVSRPPGGHLEVGREEVQTWLVRAKR